MEVLVQALGAGVGEFVVCGGARNAVLLDVLGRLEAAHKVRVWSHFEERSAGFFALGRTMTTGRPCAVVVTSGTAVAELLPAVIEAFYQGRPLVVISADRPGFFRGSGAPQAIEQEGIFGCYAASGFVGWDGLGPRHVNVELEEDLEPPDHDFSVLEPGVFEHQSERPVVGALAKWVREGALGGLVVMVGGLEENEREDVFHFCESLAVPVIADATSGLREALQHLALLGGDGCLKEDPPGRVLRLGGVPTGRFWRDLETMPEVDVWSVCRNGLRGLGREAKVMRGSLARILPAMGEMEEIGDREELLEAVPRRAELIEEALESFPDSEQGLVRTFSIYASVAGSVYLGNSLPIREWNAYAQWERPVTRVWANRGANGIDGQISSWLGATATERDAWALLGDLTVLYDVAGLHLLGQVERGGRVLAVINNGGGEIFSRMPRMAPLADPAKAWMRAACAADLEPLAKMWGLDYLKIQRADDFDALEPGTAGLLVELVPDVDQTERFPAAERPVSMKS